MCLYGGSAPQVVWGGCGGIAFPWWGGGGAKGYSFGSGVPIFFAHPNSLGPVWSLKLGSRSKFLGF